MPLIDPLEQERVMSEQKLTERISNYRGLDGLEHQGTRRWKKVDTLELSDWYNMASALQSRAGKATALKAKLSKTEEAAKFARDRLALLGHRPSSDVGMAFSALEEALAGGGKA